MANEFKYKPSPHVPFRDTKVLERVRRIRMEDITKHPNPNYRIRVLPGSEIEFCSRAMISSNTVVISLVSLAR